MKQIKRTSIPLTMDECRGMKMPSQSELENAITKGYAVINNEIQWSYESSWRKYCLAQEKTRIQIRKQDKFHSIIQLWKPDCHPFASEERMFLSSRNVPFHLDFWNWYAESDQMDTLDAKTKILALVRFFEEVDSAA